MAIWLSFAEQPRNAYEIIPNIDITPIMTFHAARYRAFGLYLEIIRPDNRIPKALNTRPTVPVIKDETDADCLYWVSMYLGIKIQ